MKISESDDVIIVGLKQKVIFLINYHKLWLAWDKGFSFNVRIARSILDYFIIFPWILPICRPTVFVLFLYGTLFFPWSSFILFHPLAINHIFLFYKLLESSNFVGMYQKTLQQKLNFLSQIIPCRSFSFLWLTGKTLLTH